MKVASRKHSYVIPQVWQSTHFVLSEGNTKCLRLDLDQVFSAKHTLPEPQVVQAGPGSGGGRRPAHPMAVPPPANPAGTGQHQPALTQKSCACSNCRITGHSFSLPFFPYKPGWPPRFLFWKAGCLQPLLLGISRQMPRRSSNAFSRGTVQLLIFYTDRSYSACLSPPDTSVTLCLPKEQ